MKNITETINRETTIDRNVFESFFDNIGIVKNFEEIQNKIPIIQQGCDCCGNKLEPGDWVIFAPAGSKTQGFQLGVVISAKKRINVGTIPHHTGWGSWNPDEVTNLVVLGERCFKIQDQEAFKTMMSTRI